LNDLQQQLWDEQDLQQQDGEQGDGFLDDFQHDGELASSIQGLLQESEAPVKLLRANPNMAEATRKAAKVCCWILLLTDATLTCCMPVVVSGFASNCLHPCAWLLLVHIVPVA
jgi:hypothetical protein